MLSTLWRRLFPKKQEPPPSLQPVHYLMLQLAPTYELDQPLPVFWLFDYHVQPKRLLKELEEHELLSRKENTYEWTEQGKKESDKWQHLLFFHNYREIFQLSLEDVFHESGDPFAIAERLLQKRLNEEQESNAWEDAQQTIYALSYLSLLQGEKMIAAFYLYQLADLEMSGLPNGFSFQKLHIYDDFYFPYRRSNYVLSSRVLDSWRSLNVDFSKEDYLQHINRSQLPMHLFSKEQSASLFQATLQQNIATVEAIYEEAHQQYLKRGVDYLKMNGQKG